MTRTIPSSTRAKRARCAQSIVFSVTLASSSAWAVVTEPNGIVVPAPSAGTMDTPLQDFFDGAGESIDAAADAAAEPGAFFPGCGTPLRAQLVLNESAARAGISWYNVPANTIDAPGQVYSFVDEGAALGTIVTLNLEGDSRYAGGAIGFVLMKDGLRVYYSEYMRNAFCSGCAMPGYWMMTLVYQADAAGAFYLAFEDWEGADATSWQGNDGDFNDQVFYVAGLRTMPCGGGMGGMGGMGGTSGAGGAGNGMGGNMPTGGTGEGGTTGRGGASTGGADSGGGSDQRGGSANGGAAGTTTGGTTGGPGGEGGEPDSGTGGRTPGEILGDATGDARGEAPESEDEESGCGCRAAGSDARSRWTSLVLAAVALLLRVGRRRARSTQATRS